MLTPRTAATLLISGIIFGVLLKYCVLLNTPTYPIIPIHSYSECNNVLDSLDENSLVLFDVDDTLLYAPDALANLRKKDLSWWFRLKMLLKFPTRFTNTAWMEPLSYMMHQAPRMLIEPTIPTLINTLHQRNIPVLALTSMESGGCGPIPHFPEWRRAMLATLGITFSTRFNDTTFSTLPMRRNTHPVLYQGALCANQQDKGLVLAAFLDHTGFAPSRVVFFDDSRTALQEVGAACARRSIPCMLFHYKQAELLPTVFCHERATAQLAHLITHKQWISDDNYPH
ncbi:MAG: hypothetical protein QG604_991 [Candidatus Dependentiae bacterium]|nr:hypothetical protein [Candidatus Dependentiae bacterium]